VSIDHSIEFDQFGEFGGSSLNALFAIETETALPEPKSPFPCLNFTVSCLPSDDTVHSIAGERSLPYFESTTLIWLDEIFGLKRPCSSRI